MPGYKVIVSELRKPLIHTAAILSSLVILLLTGSLYSDKINGQRLTAQQQLEQTERDYRNAVMSEEILRNEAVRFAALRAGGFFGPEPRLRWIQDVRETATAAKIVTIRYTLEPRQTPPPLAPTGNYLLYASTMKLELTLRHEGDLLAFLNLLEERRSGLFEVTECELDPADDKEGINLHGANVNANCELQWYTLDKPDLSASGQAS